MSWWDIWKGIVLAGKKNRPPPQQSSKLITLLRVGNFGQAFKKNPGKLYFHRKLKVLNKKNGFVRWAARI